MSEAKIQKKATTKKKVKYYNKDEVAAEIHRLRNAGQDGSIYFGHVMQRAEQLKVVV